MSVGYLLRGEANDARRAYIAFSAEQDNYLELRRRWIALRLLNQNLSMLPAANAANAREAMMRDIQETCAAILGRLAEVRSPIPQQDGSSFTLAEQLLNGASAQQMESLDPIELAEGLLDNVDLVGDQVLGELCAQSSDTREASRISAPVEPAD